MCVRCGSVTSVPTPTLSEREEIKMKKFFKCPVYDFECPYIDSDGDCSLVNPLENCDDAAACADEAEEDEEDA
jgi:hypothetical protein